jgi:hypothetical protein
MHYIAHLPLLFELAAGFALLMSAWAIGRRMRQRIERTLGIEATHESELTSLSTWMRVKDAEEPSKGDKSQ